MFAFFTTLGTNLRPSLALHADAPCIWWQAAVRKHAPNAPVVIAGASEYAYDAASLLTLDKVLEAQGEENVLFNFHPYMGPPQVD